MISKLYRDLLRAQRKAFQGDLEVIKKAQEQTRLEFRKHAPENDLPRRIEKAKSIVTFLERNLVQGELAEMANENALYKLRWTDTHEVNHRIEPVKGIQRRCC